MTQKDLTHLIKGAQEYTMTKEETETQRQSFAYGNTALSNPSITRHTVSYEAQRLKRDREY